MTGLLGFDPNMWAKYIHKPKVTNLFPFLCLASWMIYQNQTPFMIYVCLDLIPQPQPSAKRNVSDISLSITRTRPQFLHNISCYGTLCMWFQAPILYIYITRFFLKNKKTEYVTLVVLILLLVNIKPFLLAKKTKNIKPFLASKRKPIFWFYWFFHSTPIFDLKGKTVKTLVWDFKSLQALWPLLTHIPWKFYYIYIFISIIN